MSFSNKWKNKWRLLRFCVAFCCSFWFSLYLAQFQWCFIFSATTVEMKFMSSSIERKVNRLRDLLVMRYATFRTYSRVFPGRNVNKFPIFMLLFCCCLLCFYFRCIFFLLLPVAHRFSSAIHILSLNGGWWSTVFVCVRVRECSIWVCMCTRDV